MAPSDNGFSDDDEDRFDDSGAAFSSASKKRKLNRACASHAALPRRDDDARAEEVRRGKAGAALTEVSSRACIPRTPSGDTCRRRKVNRLQ